MPATIRVTYVSQVTVVQSFSGFTDPADATITVNGLNESATYTSATTPPVTKATAFTLTLTAGSGSIDLTALPGATADETIDLTGLKVQMVKLINPDSNANPITVTKGALNGYGLNAAGGAWTEVIDPGQSRTFFLNDTAPDVAAGARVWDVTGTGSQTLDVEVVAG